MTSSPEFVSAPTIEVQDLSKWFGNKVANSGISCSFGPGLTGLLGPNGAGKTTLLRVISGILAPSQGAVQLLGSPPQRNVSIYRRVGLVPEEDAVYPFLTGRQFVNYAAVLSRIPDPEEATFNALEQVEMIADAHRPTGEYSKGMRQRVKVAAALVHNPDVLLLDEPLNGTDPVQRAHLIALFRALAARGKTVIVSSHVLEEVERMADRVIAMVDGRLAAAGTVSAIRAAMTSIPYKVRIEADDPRKLGAGVLGLEAVGSVRVRPDAIETETHDLGALGRTVASVAAGLGVVLRSFEPEDVSLESVFQYLVQSR